MADQVSFKIEGIDPLIGKMNQLMAARRLREAARAAGETVKDEASQYPPESAANRPPTPYYQRGMGTVTASGVRRTSETLSKRWRVDPAPDSVTISNTASYAQFVHGQRQASFHAQRGWKQLTPTARRLMPQIQRILVQQWAQIVDLD